VTPFARENRSRRNLHGNEEKGKKEEALTVCETILRAGQDLTSLSGEAPLEGRFLFVVPVCRAKILHISIPPGVSQLRTTGFTEGASVDTKKWIRTI
jgi:hypothetical protein